MNIGFGYGKVIFFGEHFVVYGLPAMVSALRCKIFAQVNKNPGETHLFFDDRQRGTGTKKETLESVGVLLNHLLNILKIKESVSIKFTSDFCVPSGGSGASAAGLVSLVRALNLEFNLNLNDEQVNEVAYEGEKVIHGTPSGVDNTVATYGGMFLFKRGLDLKSNVVVPLQLKQPFEIVLVDSGIEGRTKESVTDVRKLKEEQPEFVDLLFKQYGVLVEQAELAIADFNLNRLGQLMNENHELLKQLTVSCDELDAMVACARELGALGAKVTGSGCGGLMLALTPGQELQNKVAREFERQGKMVIRTTVG